MKREPIKSRCINCGNEQKPDPKQSDENWNVFPTSEKCKCGGTFKLDFNQLKNV